MHNSCARRHGLPVWLLLLGSLGAIVGFSWSERDYVASAAVGFLAIGGLGGYRIGALRMLGGIGGVAAAYRFAPIAAPWLAAQLQDSVSSSHGLTRLLSLGIASLVIAVFVMLLSAVISRRLSKQYPHFEAGNQLLGFGAGTAQGAIGMLILLSGIMITAPLASQRLRHPPAWDQDQFARTVAQQIVTIADQTKRSTVGPVVARYNPFERVPQLKQLRSAIPAAKNPEVFATISDHPALATLQAKPSVRAAMQSIANDPELREIAQSGKVMDSQTAMSLLNNPTICKLLEQPELIRDITQVLGQFDSQIADSLRHKRDDGSGIRDDR